MSKNQIKRVSFYTLGCRLNQAETAILQRSFERAGYQVVDFRDPSDVVVINTCTVTENGDADTRKAVNRAGRINPEARIALVGCQAQVQRERLLQMPRVHWVVGNARKMDLPQILQSAPAGRPLVLTPPISSEPFTIAVAGIDRQHTRANLKIQDGCNFFCAFCEIPFARGRARSRDFDDLSREAEELVRAGHKEIVLTGINLGTYRFRGKTIMDVIDRLLQIGGLLRLRISSIEPTTIPETLLERMAGNKKLCRYLHVPVQSGSNRILRAMNRKHSAEEFGEFLERAQKTVPGICLGTDVIVGFPGETAADFEETYARLKDWPLAYFHVFSYSDREHARSSRLHGKVPREEIERRSRKLRELSARKRRTYLESMLGREMWVLFEQKKNGYWTGLTDTYIRVKAASDRNLANRFVPVRLEKVDGQTVMGRLL